MNKLLIIFVSCLFLQGCNFLPKLNLGNTNNVPQIVEKAKMKGSCKGQAVFNKEGVMISCSKGYRVSTEDYEKKERKSTIIEKIKGFINNLMGWSFWGIVALIIFCPSLIGFIGGRIIEGVTGIANKSLKATVKAIQKNRKSGKDLNDTLSAEQDDNVKKYIAKLKEKDNIK